MAVPAIPPARKLSRRTVLAGAATVLASTALPSTRADAADSTTADLTGAQWIRHPGGDAFAVLRRDFTVPAGPHADAHLVVTGDESVDVWLNGTWLAGSPRTAGAWRQARHVDLAAALREGANTLQIAVRGKGLIGRVKVGNAVDLVTDGSWQATTAAALTATSAATTGNATAATQAGATGNAVPVKVVGPYGVQPWGRNVAAPPKNKPSPVTVTGLTTQRRTNPLGIDVATPLFGWRLRSKAKGQIQGRYQITVGTGATTVWDSGQVASGESVDVAYGGPALSSDTTYHWRVRIWDAQGRPSPWSDTATFDTGLYDPATEWKAAFVGAPVTANLTGANWIWYPEGDPAGSAPAATRYFRRTVDLTPGGTATLVVTGDDTADVWINGVQVSASRRVTDSWKRATTIDVTGLLRQGSNTIAIDGTNTSVGPASVIAKLIVQGTTLITDANWKASTTGPDGWEQPGFDDSAWPNALVTAAYGGGPWGSNVSVPHPTPYVSKGFALKKSVARARLFATALGLHETYLNGERVGDERLSPGWTDYNKRLQYRVYDVTALLKKGGNTLGALVGNGWYSGNVGFAGTALYGSQPWYSARLAVEFTDGSTAEVLTDATWAVTASTIVDDDLYQGENQDARIAPGDGTPVTVREGTLPNLVAQVDPGVTVQQEIRPVAYTQPSPGVWIADLGQNFAGWNRLRVTGPAGTKVTLRHGEVLNPDGTLYTANLRSAQATDSFTLAGTGAAEVFEPRFTVHGYRYVELTGYPGTPSKSTLTGLAAWTAGAGTGSFTTSDDLVNKLAHNILWGARSNMLSIPTDCPQRDERLGWTGDIAAFSATSTFGFDTHGLLSKFTDDLTDAQQGNGAFTDVAPAVAGGSGRAGWADAGVIVPYNVWQRFGDLSIVDRHYDAMKKYVEYLRATSGSDLIRDQDTYGDWLNVNDNTANDLTSTAYFGWSTRLLSRIAAATGRTADATSYGALADAIAAAFTARFVAADGTVGSNSQTGYVLALAFGLVPADRAQAVADKLAAAVDARDGHLSVGFMGVENLLPVLADHGHLDTAYRILQQPGYPGWGWMISQGATTVWERWDGIETSGAFEDPGMNSFNHYGLGSVGDWLYREVGGVAAASPGYRRVLLAPRPGGSLTAATASHLTPYGETASSWRVTGSELTLGVVVAPNATATVRVPASSADAVTAPPEAVPLGYADGAASYALGSGSYTFTSLR